MQTEWSSMLKACLFVRNAFEFMQYMVKNEKSMVNIKK